MVYQKQFRFTSFHIQIFGHRIRLDTGFWIHPSRFSYPDIWKPHQRFEHGSLDNFISRFLDISSEDTDFWINHPHISYPDCWTTLRNFGQGFSIFYLQIGGQLLNILDTDLWILSYPEFWTSHQSGHGFLDKSSAHFISRILDNLSTFWKQIFGIISSPNWWKTHPHFGHSTLEISFAQGGTTTWRHQWRQNPGLFL